MNPNKRHLRYFQKTDTLRSVGIALLICGGVIFYFGRGIVLYFDMIGLLPLSVFLILLGTVGRSTDMEINSVIKLKTEGMEVDLQNNERVGKHLIKSIDPLTVSGYEFSDGLPIKRAKNNELRTPNYCKAILYPLRDCLYVVRVQIDLLTEKEQKDILEIPYESISTLSSQTEKKEVSVGKRIYAVKSSHLVIERAEEESIKLPIRESAVIDSFIDNIKRHMAGEL